MKGLVGYSNRIVPVILNWVAGIFCLSATEFAHHICECPHRVSGKIGRGCLYQVYFVSLHREIGRSN